MEKKCCGFLRFSEFSSGYVVTVERFSSMQRTLVGVLYQSKRVFHLDLPLLVRPYLFSDWMDSVVSESIV